MACVHLHQRLTMPMTYQVMIGVAFVILIPYTAPAYDDLPKELVLPLSLAGKAIQFPDHHRLDRPGEDAPL